MLLSLNAITFILSESKNEEQYNGYKASAREYH